MQKVPNVTLIGPSVILTPERAFVQTDHLPRARIQNCCFLQIYQTLFGISE